MSKNKMAAARTYNAHDKQPIASISFVILFRKINFKRGKKFSIATLITSGVKPLKRDMRYEFR